MKTGLRQQIRTAKSEKEIDNLLSHGHGYKYVSNSIRNRWKLAAVKRLRELQLEKEKKSKKKKKSTPKKKSLKKKK